MKRTYKIILELENNNSFKLFNKPLKRLTLVEFREMEFYKFTGVKEEDVESELLYFGGLTDDHHLCYIDT